MTLKAAVGSLIALVFSLLLLAIPAACVEAPTYDMTGTWSHWTANFWTNCATSPVYNESGTVIINQTGSSFTGNLDGEAIQGTVSGSRYQIFDAGSISVGSSTNTVTWALSTPTFASGYVSGTFIGGCSFIADLYVQKQTPFSCNPSDTAMCLRNGRYSVSVTWKNQQGQSGVGHAVPFTDDSGLFWFFSDSNMELLIKVLNGCSFNDHYWVFFAATTDQEFTVTVTDLKTAQQVQYTNPLKNPADAVTDTSAFATCP
jgi:hypothetical protein